MSAIEYSFNRKEMNNWKGRITERLIRCYIDDVLIPTLRKQGWDDAIFAPQGDSMSEGSEMWSEMEVRFLVANGLFPTRRFLTSFKKLTNLLENLPDGFLIKIKKTGITKPLKEAIKEFKLDGWSYHNEKGEPIFDYSRFDKNEILPVVDGEIEVVEVKSDKATLPARQKRSYGNILREGYVLRFFHVNIVSFEKNEFEIEEKLLTSPNELKTFPIKGKAK